MILTIGLLIIELCMAQTRVTSIPLDEYMKMTSEICNDSRMKDYFHSEHGYDGLILFVQFPPGLKVEGAENREYSMESAYGTVILLYKNSRFHHNRMAWFEYREIEYNNRDFRSIFKNYNHVDSTDPDPIREFKVRARFTNGQFTSIQIKA